MSLEQAIQRNNELLEQLITVLQSGALAATELGAPDKPARTRKTKDAAAPAPSPEAAGETIYWLIEKHNTVYEQKPGTAGPGIEGAVQVTREVFEAKKLERAESLDAILAKNNAAKTDAPAPTPPTAEAATASAAPASTTTEASSTTQAATASAAAPAGDVPFTAVMDKMKALNASTLPGHGRDGVLSILKQFLPKDEQPTVTKLQPLGKNAEVIAAVDKLMAPAAEFDPLA